MTQRIARLALGLGAAVALAVPALPANAAAVAECHTPKQCVDQFIHDTTCITPLCSPSGS